jgi:hypothetical protein
MIAHRSHRRVTIVVAVATVAVVAGGGSAFAFWATTGAGTGAATASTLVAPVITAGTVTGDLYPGLTANGTSTGGTLAISASNPNPFPVTVTLAPSTSATGCTTPAVSFRGGTLTLPAKASDVSHTFANSMSMGANASNDCQGKPITVVLTTSTITS